MAAVLVEEQAAPSLAPSRHPIGRLLLRRLLTSLPTLVLVTAGIFVLLDLAPGDAAHYAAGEDATPERVEEVRQQLGLDEPVVVRYIGWLGDAVRGDLSESLRTGEPVADIVRRALPQTLSLVGLAMTGAALIGSAVGIIAALRPKGLVARLLTVGSSLAIAIPPYLLVLVLVSTLSVERNLLPAVGYVSLGEDPVEWFRRLVIPATGLGAVAAAEMARQVRSAMSEVLSRDYILAARAKGLGGRRIVVQHALRNAGVPILTVMGSRFSSLLGGSVLVETICVIHGIGDNVGRAALSKDIPVVTGLVLTTAILVVVVNTVIDLLYAWLNPKLREA